MPKATKTPPDTEGEISVQIVKFTMKGSDASLQKGLDTIKAAFVQAGLVPAPPERQLRANGVKQLPTADEETPENTDEILDAVSQEAEPEPEARVARKESTPRKPPNYKIIPGLKFDDVKPAFAEFAAGKDPKTDLNKYLCIAYWFKHHKGAQELTVEHYFTAYKVMGWTTPANPSVPIGNLRSQSRQWLSTGATQGTTFINNLGETKVEAMGKAEE
jgi:hypothetical protein